MSAAPNPQDDSRKEPEEVVKFRRDYEDALAHARVSAEHTATEGWLNLYGGHMEAVNKDRKSHADRLGAILEPMRLRHLTENEEKEMSEIRKGLIALREYDQAFRKQTIEPVIAPLQECDACIEAARAAARAAEREFGLGNRGLSEVMETVIDTMPRVKFMTASGRLVVGD